MIIPPAPRLSSFSTNRIWRRGLLALWLACLLPVACTLSRPLTPPDVQPGVYGKLYTPTSPGPHPAIVVLHGLLGIHPDYHSLAKILAEHGYVTLVANYYAETGAVEREDTVGRRQKWPIWQRSVQNSVQYLQALPGVQAEHIGVIGISQGAFLAISTAGITPAIKAVVDYYGGGTSSLEEYVQDLPPVLILHGDADDVVPVSYAKTLYDALVRHSKTVDMHIYPGVPHGFTIKGRWYDSRAAVDAQERTLTFLDKHLKTR